MRFGGGIKDPHVPKNFSIPAGYLLTESMERIFRIFPDRTFGT
jgi:hypothetical protein